MKEKNYQLFIWRRIRINNCSAEWLKVNKEAVVAKVNLSQHLLGMIEETQDAHHSGLVLAQIWTKNLCTQVKTFNAWANLLSDRKNQDMQCTYNVTFRRFRETIVAVEKL